MGQKIHPLGFRVGITKKHKSHWFATSQKYPQLLVEDYFLRKTLFQQFSDAGIESIEIQRQLDQIKIEIRAVRVDVLIGRKNTNLEQVRQSLEQKLKVYRLKNFNVINLSSFGKSQLKSKLACSKNLFHSDSQFILEPYVKKTKKPVLEQSKSESKINKTVYMYENRQLPSFIYINSAKITIHVIKLVNPNKKAKCIADFLVEQLEKRGSFRFAMRQAIRRCQKAQVQGIKIQIAGRLNGAEIARTEWVRKGRVPLHTLTANIDFSYKTAKTIYGILGIKVWIFTGENF